MTDGNYNGGFGGFGGEWIFAFLIIAVIFNGGGFFGGNRDANAATQSDITRGFNFNQLDNGIRGLERGQCQLGYDNLAQFKDISQQFSNCCCETNRNIDAVRYDNSRNTCDIIQAGHEDTQRILDRLCAMETQDLRYRLEDSDRKLMTANFQLSQQAQTSNILGQIGKYGLNAPTWSCGNLYNNGCGCSIC